jgi:hypothetical protein
VNVETDAMECQRIGDEQLQADKMDVLYQEADAATRQRVEAHLGACLACREELAGLERLRGDLAAWRLPRRPGLPQRLVVVPRWLAAAAALLLGLSLSLGAGGYLSLRRALAAEQARAAALEAGQRRAQLALEQALRSSRELTPPGAGAEQRLLARVDAQVDARLGASEARQAQQLELRFAQWSARLDAQRRVDLARVADGLRYIESRHGEQLARTNELMGYVLESAAQSR